mmetsp:Transcript_10844/g.22944  ORF Transcript_10844/g.22944 Transcript_10844/m.22944 type:complete len:101 (+) Transcript_10844:109-411(+)
MRVSFFLCLTTVIDASLTKGSLRGLKELLQRQTIQGLEVSIEEFVFCTRIKTGKECHSVEGGGRCAFCPDMFDDDEGVCLPSTAFGMACPRSRQRLNFSM